VFVNIVYSFATVVAGPSRATAGPGKLLSRGPITTPFRRHRDRVAEGREGEGVEREEQWLEYGGTRGNAVPTPPVFSPKRSPPQISKRTQGNANAKVR